MLDEALGGFMSFLEALGRGRNVWVALGGTLKL
jgi:hypothetical protein